MIRIALCGYGQMGKLLAQQIQKSQEAQLIMIIDRSNRQDIYHLQDPLDLLLDFSHPDNLEHLLPYVKETRCAFLSGTTGMSEQQMAQIKELGEVTRVMHAANYGLGIAIFLRILKTIMPLLEESFDVEVLEMHHHQKQDAPSGTALLLLEALDPDHRYQKVYGRYGNQTKRGKEIGIHALRGGSVAGEHSVLFLGEEEKLEIKHTALSRQVFVNGALHAARWLIAQDRGYYTMEDLVGGS